MNISTLVQKTAQCYTRVDRAERGGMMSTEALRAFWYEMRTGRGVSQKAIAEAIGLSTRAIINYEQGENEIRVSTYLLGMRHLGVSSLPVDVLAAEGATANDGRRAALKQFQDDEPIEAKIDRIVAGVDPERLRKVVQEMVEEYERRPTLLGRLQTWLAGWRASHDD